MKTVIGSLVMMAMLSACGIKGGEEFVGKWVNLKYSDYVLNIERNGDGFIVRDTHSSFRSGKLETKNIPAIYKDGMLHVSLEYGDVSMAIDKASGNITDGRFEYKRVK